MARPRTALVIPTLDEEEAIAGVIAAAPGDAIDEVIVVDSGSTDRTVDRARAAGARVLALRERGYGRACRAGAEAASDCDVIVFLDGDGSDCPELIPHLIEPIAENRYDFVIGSRSRGTREPGSMTAHQLIAGRVVGAATRLLYGVHYTDMCPFRVIRRDAMMCLGMREDTYGWNLEMQMRAARAGLRILEVPVAHRRRAGGSSKVSGTLRGTLKASCRILVTFIRIALEGRGRPEALPSARRQFR
ncbi:MAG: glycosyltransferase family 2 protein [Alphaproteobacteria bacterium]|nr:glycosyltransferase family 2 protein [Alphaproteobacteria bacterium]MBV9586430.1 glycosyltransferase family 2 protein [Alphaproteobacteria bacterium]